MSSKEMMKTSAKPGYWWVNKAPLGERPDWQQEVIPHDTSGMLFGYEENAFLRRQYK